MSSAALLVKVHMSTAFSLSSRIGVAWAIIGEVFPVPARAITRSKAASQSMIFCCCSLKFLEI